MIDANKEPLPPFPEQEYNSVLFLIFFLLVISSIVPTPSIP